MIDSSETVFRLEQLNARIDVCLSGASVLLNPLPIKRCSTLGEQKSLLRKTLTSIRDTYAPSTFAHQEAERALKATERAETAALTAFGIERVSPAHSRA